MGSYITRRRKWNLSHVSEGGFTCPEGVSRADGEAKASERKKGGILITSTTKETAYLFSRAGKGKKTKRGIAVFDGPLDYMQTGITFNVVSDGMVIPFGSQFELMKGRRIVLLDFTYSIPYYNTLY